MTCYECGRPMWDDDASAYPGNSLCSPCRDRHAAFAYALQHEREQRNLPALRRRRPGEVTERILANLPRGY